MLVLEYNHSLESNSLVSLDDLFEFDTIGVYRGVDGDMDELIPCYVGM